MENILNVTLIEPQLKHPTIFNRFDELVDGNHFYIHNDHDPKPLYYHMLGERGNIFTWEYIEQGPEFWNVRITKKLGKNDEETIGQIAAKDIRKAQVFNKYGLDFCCGGKKTLREACLEKGLNETQVEFELNQFKLISVNEDLTFDDWNLDILVDYIVSHHHEYVRRSLPELLSFAVKVMNAHGAAHPELIKIKQLVEEINAELMAHMVKEELVLFPFIKEMVSSGADTLLNQPFGSVQNPLNLMEMEHELVGKHLEEISALSDNYSLPANACSSFQMFYKLLQEFTSDLHLHVHLENNILFPKTIELEKSFRN